MWNADLYEQFGRERLQPSIDLAAKIEGAPNTILDVGCGSGMSTLCLRNRFPNAAITGVDLSAGMLEKAKQLSLNVDFLQKDCSQSIEELGKFDLVFSNAFLQWLDNQEVFLCNIRSNMNENAVLAMQIPAFHQMKISEVIVDAANQCFPKCFSGRFSTIRVVRNLSMRQYYDMFTRYFSDVTVWKIDYVHQFDNSDRIVEFVKGTALIPYMERLNEAECAQFLAELKKQTKRAYPTSENGTVLFPFERMFFIAKAPK